MTVAIPNKKYLETYERVIGASVFAPVTSDAFYEAVRDVRSFPDWAPGMLSEWEVSFPGLRKTVRSVLEEVERPELLRWSYDGPVEGWGECAIRERGNGTLAEFRTGLVPADRRLESLMGSSMARGAAGCVIVGPPVGLL